MFEHWAELRRLLLAYVPAKPAAPAQLRPALAWLREVLPDVYLALWVEQEHRQAAALLPGIDALLVTPAGWQAHGEPVIALIDENGFDAAIILSEQGASPYGAAYACYLAGVPVRIGHSLEFGGGVLSHRIYPPSVACPPAEHHLHLLAASGLPLPPPPPGETGQIRNGLERQ